MAAIGLTVGNLAHNMKNLLAVNQGAGHLMDAHLKERDYEQIEKRWQQIKRGLEGIGRLSNEMLAFVKKDDLYLKSVDVNQLILSNRQTFEHSFAHDGLSIQYLLSPKRPVWKLDGVQFQRALQNLVLNAVDAVAKKKKAIIRISTSVHKERYLLVSVADNGCGIPKDRLKRVLELFYTTKGTRGTGLGLPTVNKFVQQSGGKLKLVSKEGRGTIFQMVFPRR
jgi:signal transduction histidine kinase